MTMTPTPVLEDIDTIGTGHDHIACCKKTPKVFLCGAPYHPECDRKDDEAKHEVDCASCAKIRDRSVCEEGHHHCPFNALIECPSKRAS